MEGLQRRTRNSKLVKKELAAWLDNVNVKDNDKVMGQLIGRFIGMTVVEIRV